MEDAEAVREKRQRARRVERQRGGGEKEARGEERRGERASGAEGEQSEREGRGKGKRTGQRGRGEDCAGVCNLRDVQWLLRKVACVAGVCSFWRECHSREKA